MSWNLSRFLKNTLSFIFFFFFATFALIANAQEYLPITSFLNTSTLTYTSNSLNQYTQITNGSLTTNLVYDLNANLISKTGVRQSGRPVRRATSTFSYDYENRLNKVVRGKLTATFTYDAFGRRISKKVNKTAPDKYIYDADNIILDLDNSNKIIAKYIYGPDTDEPLVMIKGTKKYYYSKDGLGSIVNLTNSSGKVAESYTYDEYGKPLNSSSIGNRFLFTGREYDKETGLYYYRARYYDPIMGRFLQTDPIGYEGGINLYQYAGNNPVNYIDPWGLEWLDMYAKKGGGSSGGAPSSGGGWGHSWGDITDTSGNRYGGGFYPGQSAGPKSIFGGNYGKAFRDDTARKESYDVKGSWEITKEQYNKIKSYISNFQAKGGDWTMGKPWKKSNNCTDYVVGMLDAAGIKHPNFKTFGKTDPDKLAKWLEELEQKNKKCKK